MHAPRRTSHDQGLDRTAFAEAEDGGFPQASFPGDGCEYVLLGDDLWAVFEVDDETAEPEPEPGDFWGVLDDTPDI